MHFQRETFITGAGHFTPSRGKAFFSCRAAMELLDFIHRQEHRMNLAPLKSRSGNATVKRSGVPLPRHNGRID